MVGMELKTLGMKLERICGFWSGWEWCIRSVKLEKKNYYRSPTIKLREVAIKLRDERDGGASIQIVRPAHKICSTT